MAAELPADETTKAEWVILLQRSRLDSFQRAGIPFIITILRHRLLGVKFNRMCVTEIKPDSMKIPVKSFPGLEMKKH